jgi:hypothetical protein
MNDFLTFAQKQLFLSLMIVMSEIFIEDPNPPFCARGGDPWNHVARKTEAATSQRAAELIHEMRRMRIDAGQ